MRRHKILLPLLAVLLVGLGCARPECDPDQDNGILQLAEKFQATSKERDELRGDRWFWCEHGLPEWAWESVPLEYRTSRMVNLRDQFTYFQGLGTWIHVTKVEIQNQIASDLQAPITYPSKAPAYAEAYEQTAKKIATYAFIKWLYGAGIIIRRVNDPSLGVYDLESTIKVMRDRCTERADGPNTGKESPPGAEPPDQGGVILPPIPSGGGSSSGGDF